jgi:manganese/iron transport system substrate-binding protein
VADFARQIVGDRCTVKCVLDAGADPHLFRPTANDVKLVASADLCLENGWNLEGHEWMKTLAKDAGKTLVTCVEGVQPIMLEEDGKKDAVRDPHTWFSPKNAAIYVRNILNAVSQLEPKHKAEFEARAQLLLDELRTLDLWIKRQVSAIPPNQRVLVTSHDAFHYFCQEYGFKSAAPAGWSTGEEVGAGVTADSRRETVASIRKHGVKAIFVETSVNEKLIEEIAAEAGVKIGGKLYSDSMGPPNSAGESYLGMMRENVITIVHALK